MAYFDYTHCAVCDCKCYYDARVEYHDEQCNPRYGDHKALCKECLKSYNITIVKRNPDLLEEKKEGV